MTCSATTTAAKVDLLVTVGSGVQRLNGFRELYRNATLRSIGWWSIGAMAALAAGIVLVVGALGPGVPGLWAWSGVVLVVAGVLYSRDLQPLGGGAKGAGGQRRRGRLPPGGALGDGLCPPGRRGPHGRRPARGQVDRAPAARRRLAAGGGDCRVRVAYGKVETQVEIPPQLALPPGAVTGWVDYYSTADPVPNGPLVTWTTAKARNDTEAVHPAPRMVYNLRSVHADHSFYFDNADEFVSQLALDLAARGDLDLDPL